MPKCCAWTPASCPRGRGVILKTCEILVEQFGKDRPVVDLSTVNLEQLRASLARTWGTHALSGEVQRVRTIRRRRWRPPDGIQALRLVRQGAGGADRESPRTLGDPPGQ